MLQILLSKILIIMLFVASVEKAVLLQAVDQYDRGHDSVRLEVLKGVHS